jgi:hypothetical protein
MIFCTMLYTSGIQVIKGGFKHRVVAMLVRIRYGCAAGQASDADMIQASAHYFEAVFKLPQ